MRPPRPRRPGFSLVELMFSMAIGSIILMLAATMLGSSGEGYERVGGSVAVEREARAAITQLASDLSSARYHKDNLFEKSSSTWPADRLGFLSLQPAQAQTDAGRIGDLCAVNYHVKDLTIGGKTVRCLMRGFRESNDTFKALGDDTVPTLFGEAAKVDEPVAFGVISFEVRPKSRDATGKWIDWVRNDKTGPQALDTRLILARRSLNGKLKLPADWDGAGATGRLLGTPAEAARNKDLEVYESLIEIGNAESP